MTIEQKVELKHCPFCGCDADLFIHSINPTQFTIGCRNGMCGVFFNAETKEEATATWNNRHHDPQFFSEIKKRCMEECEKQMILPDDWKDMAEFNNGCKHCIQAIDRMEVE